MGETAAPADTAATAGTDPTDPAAPTPPTAPTGSLALSVHGPAGAVDLVVPAEAAVADVAREYAAQCRLDDVPQLHTRRGRALGSQLTLTEAGLVSGDVVGATGRPRGVDGLEMRRVAPRRTARATPGALSALWCAVAAGIAALAGWTGVQTSGADQRVVVGLLLATAVVGVLPVGRVTAHRRVAAPVFGGAAAFVLAWSPEPARLPVVVGVAALAAAVTAATARALDNREDEALRVWMVTGVLIFAVAVGGVVLDRDPQVVWAVLLVLATLAARFVPALAVDVPDQYLIDIERLAVTAWSARERPTGRRGRTVVSAAAIATVAARGTRTVDAACAAILVVAGGSSVLLLRTATLPIDRIGARVMVLAAAATLLLTARSYRHLGARALLRLAGLACGVAGVVVLLALVDGGVGTVLGLGVVALALLLVLVAVATGRGWRSAWWSRRAEVAEALGGATTIGALLVAAGLFRSLWELKFRV